MCSPVRGGEFALAFFLGYYAEVSQIENGFENIQNVYTVITRTSLALSLRRYDLKNNND